MQLNGLKPVRLGPRDEGVIVVQFQSQSTAGRSRVALLGAAIVSLSLSPLAMAIFAEEAAFERFHASRAPSGVPAVEAEGAVQLTESGVNNEFTQKIETRIKRKRGEDPNALENATRSGLLKAPTPKIITLFPSSEVPQSGYTGGDYGGSYRTVCVRLCDGFYWPISYGTSRGEAYDDKQTCESSCGSEVKLFVVPTGADISEASDLRGKPYSRLKNAFRYRNEYVPSCKCKADPWEQASLDRHKKYAALAKEGKLAYLDEGVSRKKKRRRQSDESATFVSYKKSKTSITTVSSSSSSYSTDSIFNSPGSDDSNLLIVTAPTKKSKKASSAKGSTSDSAKPAKEIVALTATIKSTKKLSVIGGKRSKGGEGYSSTKERK